MPVTAPDIIDFEVGLRVAIRSGNQSWYGVFSRVTKSTAVVELPDGTKRAFGRHSRFEIGSKESRYTRPYICTIARAQHADREYKQATERARANLQRQGVVC